jgi:gluconokinase
MPPVDVVLALDISSSGVRARAHAADRRVCAEHAVDLATRLAADGSSTHDLDSVLAAVRSVLRPFGTAPDLRILGLSASGTASSLALAELNDGVPQKNAEVLLWSDTRSAAVYPQLAAQLTAAYPRTLCPPDVSYWPAKLLYLAGRSSPSPRGAIAGVKDLVFAWLTGRLWTDPMTAGSTGIFDSQAWQWDTELLHSLHIPEAVLPEVHDATAHAPLTAQAAVILGLPAGLPVVLGGMDGPLTQLGAAGLREDIASCTIGTSIAFRTGSAQRRIDPQARTWCYPVSRSFWVLGGAGSNGGNLLTWLSDRLHLTASVAELVDRAFSVAPDPALTFVPYLHGERAPLWRSDLRAAFLGLSSRHGVPNLTRAVLEGLAASVLELAAAVESTAGTARQVVFTGGFLREPRWGQLMTDALGSPTFVPVPDVATSTGAAMIGWSAVEGTPLDEGFTPALAPLAQPDPTAHERVQRTAERIVHYRRILWPEQE